MFAIRLRTAARSRRGQTMVLGVIGITIVAVMMMMTLNVGQSIHEKIRIQQLADASAFSTATQEARVFNYLAYTNRANIGALVSASSLHSFQSMASAIPEMFHAAYMTFLLHAGIEFAVCATCCWPFCFAMCKHCWHGIKDLRAANNYRKTRNKYRKRVKNTETLFRAAVTALDLHMYYIMVSQKLTIGKVLVDLETDAITKEIQSQFHPAYIAKEGGDDVEVAQGMPIPVRALNGGSYNLLNVPGAGRGFTDTFEKDKTINKWVPTMIANGTRISKGPMEIKLRKWFVSDRGFIDILLFPHFTEATKRLLQTDGKPAKGMSISVFHKGQGRIIEGPDSPRSKIESGDLSVKGDTAAAFDRGIILSMGFICIFSMIPMVWPYEVWVASGPDGGKHKETASCAGESKHKFTCLDLELLGMGCFTVFKADDNPMNNFGQPVVYSLLTQDLSEVANVNQDAVFNAASELDLNSDMEGSLNINTKMEGDVKNSEGKSSLDTGGDVEVHIANKVSQYGRGVAMSKALVYYHYPAGKKDQGEYRSDGWKEHPNFFNPYWKAKLHPFRRPASLNWEAAEAAVVLTAGGQMDYIPALPLAPVP